MVPVVALATTLVSAHLSSATGSQPASTEIGVDAKTIHIAIVADVDNSIAPNLLRGAVDGAKGAVKMINAQGGLAGRKLALDFLDSKLNPTEARNAFITACGQDFAMVGGGTFLISSYDDINNCPDKSGQAIGIPNLPGVTVGSTQSCSPVTFPLNSSQIDCATVDQAPQRYQGLIGDSKYLAKKYGPLHGPIIVSSDSKDTQRATSVLGLLAEKGGIKISDTIPKSSFDPQTAYTTVIQQLKSSDANYLLTGAPADNVIAMRQEAELQGFTDPNFLWVCQLNCYDKKLVSAGSAVDGTRVIMSFLPFEEAKYNKTLANFVKYVGKDKINGFAVWGFASTLLFQQAVESVVKEHGVNGLTRANLLTAVKNIHDFNAGGMFGTVDTGNKGTTPCFMILKLEGGKYSREYPKKKGTLDCKPSNHASIERDLLSQ